MAEFTANAIQGVASGANVVFTDTVVEGCDLIYHRSGSGVVKLFPINGKCYTRYKVFFSGNIAVPTDGTVGAISVALSIDGEPVATTTAIVTPAAVDEYFNVATAAYIYVRHGCCSTVAVRNITATDINVQNANIIITRE